MAPFCWKSTAISSAKWLTGCAISGRQGWTSKAAIVRAPCSVPKPLVYLVDNNIERASWGLLCYLGMLMPSSDRTAQLLHLISPILSVRERDIISSHNPLTSPPSWGVWNRMCDASGTTAFQVLQRVTIVLTPFIAQPLADSGRVHQAQPAVRRCAMAPALPRICLELYGPFLIVTCRSPKALLNGQLCVTKELRAIARGLRRDKGRPFNCSVRIPYPWLLAGYHGLTAIRYSSILHRPTHQIHFLHRRLSSHCASCVHLASVKFVRTS